MAAPSRRTFKILIVDDQATDVATLNFLAHSLGFEAHLAFDGSDAWDMIQNETYDLIILDWYMPIVPGWAFLKRLEQSLDQSQTHRRHSRNVIIHTTEPIHIGDFTEKTAFRILDVWHKPIDLVQALHRIKQIRTAIGA